jgi:hypothetical protein
LFSSQEPDAFGGFSIDELAVSVDDFSIYIAPPATNLPCYSPARNRRICSNRGIVSSHRANAGPIAPIAVSDPSGDGNLPLRDLINFDGQRMFNS